MTLEDLPLIDEHSVAVAAAPSAVFDAVLRRFVGALSSRGRAYRAAVIGTRFHVIATNALLRNIAKSASAIRDG